MRSRKMSQDKAADKRRTNIILAVILLILIMVLAALWFFNRDQSGQAPSGNGSTDSTAQVIGGEIPETAAKPQKETLSETRGTSDTTGKADAATQPETTAAAETKPAKLETLDGIPAGTVVTKEDLDLDNPNKYFQAYEIKTTGATYPRINGKSYKENPDVALSDIRYLKVLHYNFNHESQVGEIIVNKGLAEDVLQIFRELYDAEYEIQSMHLVDNYWTGDGIESDSASIDKNNTSAFNYRPAVGSGKLSNHAYGFAIDINPQQNPYVSYKTGKPKWEHENANDYIDRSSGRVHMITHEDKAYKIFKAHGFKWGGDWESPKDYQHFEKKSYQ